MNSLDRQSAQVHRLISPLAEVLLAAKVETVLAVFELLAKKETIPHESVTLEEEEEEAMLSCGVLLVTWCFLGPFLLTWLDWGASALSLVLLVFADLPVC